MNNIKTLHDIFIENLGYKNTDIKDFWKNFNINIDNELNFKYKTLIENIFTLIENIKIEYYNDIIKIKNDFKAFDELGIKINNINKITDNITMFFCFGIGLAVFIFLYFFKNYEIEISFSIAFFSLSSAIFIRPIVEKFYNLEENNEFYRNKKISHDLYLYFYSLISDENFFNKCHNNFINQIKKQKRKESKNNLLKMNPYEFEKITADLFTYFGFSAKVTKGSGDHGIDINLTKDGEKFIVQCKRYNGKIGTPLIRDFIGTMQLSGINKGFFVTTSIFSSEVVKLIKKNSFDIKLVDLDTLYNLITIKNDGLNVNKFDEIMGEGLNSIVINANKNILAKKAGWDKYRGV